VEKVASSTALTVAPMTGLTWKTKVTLTARVSPAAATGQVRFSDSGHVLGTATLSNGVATLIASGIYGGKQALTAAYLGDDNTLPSTSAAVRVKVKDTAKPVITRPKLARAAATPTATFLAKDKGGVREVQIRHRYSQPGKTKLGKWLTVQKYPGTTTSWTRAVLPARTKLCVSVRALDYANKFSGWKTKCRIVR
jgi:hypothetical protein